MAAPTVFVSSTFYDLHFVRESLKRFIEQMGYTPILSEDGTVFFDPSTTAAESCLKEVANADMLVLLIGGRYGSHLPASEQSVTNGEFLQAVEKKIPVFALIEQGTYGDYAIYGANSVDPEVVSRMKFPNADSVKIFEFIDAVKNRSVNNALVSFSTVADIESYLRSQWAGMLQSSLSTRAKEAQVVDTLSVLTQVNERVELIAERILRSVGTPLDRTYVRLLQTMVKSQLTNDVRMIGGNVTPGAILESKDLESCINRIGSKLTVSPEYENGEIVISGSGEVSQDKFDLMRNDFFKIKDKLTQLVESDELNTSDITTYERTNGE